MIHTRAQYSMLSIALLLLVLVLGTLASGSARAQDNVPTATPLPIDAMPVVSGAQVSEAYTVGGDSSGGKRDWLEAFPEEQLLVDRPPAVSVEDLAGTCHGVPRIVVAFRAEQGRVVQPREGFLADRHAHHQVDDDQDHQCARPVV